jgi:hypothetical protein
MFAQRGNDMAQHLDVVLPIAMVAMAFILKLFMDRSATTPLIIRSLYEVPVDVVFLALSFTTAYTIANLSNVSTGMCHLYIFFIVALIAVVLWRRSILLFEGNHQSWSAVLFVVNGSVSGYILYKAINLIVTKGTP